LRECVAFGPCMQSNASTNIHTTDEPNINANRYIHTIEDPYKEQALESKPREIIGCEIWLHVDRADRNAVTARQHLLHAGCLWIKQSVAAGSVESEFERRKGEGP
jgi:hypothetical protein